MNLDAATWNALDWPVVLDALAEQARTPMGVRAVRALEPLPDAEHIRRAYDAVEDLLDLWRLGRDVRIGDVADIGPSLSRASKGDVLEPGQLRRVCDTAAALDALRHALMEDDEHPVLATLAEPIVVDPMLLDELSGAFDELGQLSGKRWPELADLRERINGLHAHIRSTLDAILRDEGWKDVLQDDFVTQRQERYVVPVKSHAKRWDLGIVHGTSGSGQTVFVEPTAVVEANNRLRIAEGQLEAAERRILSLLSRLVGSNAESLTLALEAATAIDVVVARAGLARRLDMTRPKVGDRGDITLIEARHPVLLVRGVKVVPNDLHVGGDTPVLVLSGPNAGGKTVALKTLGLCAELVRLGCFVPAAAGSRVDHFTDVLADIGDSQAISEDLSSFTGQLTVLRAMLDRARPGALLLLDEVATGTDPTQGAALAAAVVEELADRGATVVATTHYAQLKGLAATRDGFAIAAVEHGGGTPTYKVVAGATGESHGLEVAARVGMPQVVLDRAESHLGDAERTFTRALEELDAERDRLRIATRELDQQRAAFAEQERSLAVREAELARNAKALEERAASGFRDRLKSAEDAIRKVVAELQRAPDHKGVAKARATVEALRGIAPEVEAPAPEAPTLEVGDRVRLRTGASTGGKAGEVVDVRADKVTVKIGALSMRVPLSDVERVRSEPEKPASRPRKRPKPGKERRVPVDQAVRLPGNTLDLRGERVDEAIDKVELFLDTASRRGFDSVFVLHGHGTGALKSAVREHLRTSAYIASAAPANADQGGDAYTVAVLR